MKKDLWVVRQSDGWAVKREGSGRAGGQQFSTQREAIAAGRAQAQAERAELFIQNRQGRIRERNSYGHDPYPPKG